MAPRVERKLAAILAADVVGYSRLVGADEQGTLDRLKAHRKELVEPLVAEHGGRVVKLMGDGILCEFPSAVHAVTCAVAIQRGMAEREAATPRPTHPVPHRHQRRRRRPRGRRYPRRRGQRRRAARGPGRAGRGLHRPQRAQPGQRQDRPSLRAHGPAPGQEHRRAGRGLARSARRCNATRIGQAPSPRTDRDRRQYRDAARPSRRWCLVVAAEPSRRRSRGRSGALDAHGTVNRRAAVHELLYRRPGPGILRRWRDRGHHYRAVEVPALPRDRPQLDLPLQGGSRGRAPGRHGSRGELRSRGQRAGRSPERIRVSVQLLDATDGDHVWGQTYDET